MTHGLRWKEAASLVLAFKCVPKLSVPDQVFNYKLLFSKPTESEFKSGPDNYVNFPRGVVNSADFSPVWFNLFEYATKINSNLRPVTKIDRKPRPPVLQSDTYGDFNEVFGTNKILAPDVALRLTALRQTFLESGILLARKEDDSYKVAENISVDISKWLPRVNDDPSEFIQLCEQKRCCPDVWSMFEWSNWLTPPYSSTYSQRFDTSYFVYVLNKEIILSSDNKDIQCWAPEEVLQLYSSGKVWLSVEQLYDLGRLRRFNIFEELESFSKHRATYGLDRWCAIRIYGNDGFVTVMKGDDLYPADVDLATDEPKYGFPEKSLHEISLMAKNVNRFEKVSTQLLVNCNISLPYGHMIPLSQTDYIPNAMV